MTIWREDLVEIVQDVAGFHFAASVQNSLGNRRPLDFR